MKIAQVDIGNSFFGGSHFLRDLTGVGMLVSIFVSNAIVVAGIILLFLLIFGGIGMMAGAGGKNPQKLAQGKQAVTAAVIGFIIIITAYWIVMIVGRMTGNSDILG
ncbi:hypothetical protein KKB40_06405 [Patescibacteria group bacterium]|nr:hypothetical protein [Patescibacteria group bacterium]